MKKIYFLLIFLLFNLTVRAQIQNQESAFMGNIWWLQKLEINNNIIPAPNNSELNFPQLSPFFNNNEYYFLKEHCKPGVGQAFFDFVSPSTFFIKNYVVTTTFCKNLSNEEFITQFYDNNFIWDNVNSNFQYIITDNITYLELIITGQNGNKAYYHNNLSASINKFDLRDKITLYPNPASNEIFIKGDNKTLDEIEKIMFYNSSGKLVLSTKINMDRSINLSLLSSGIYSAIFVINNQIINYGSIIKL